MLSFFFFLFFRNEISSVLTFQAGELFNYAHWPPHLFHPSASASSYSHAAAFFARSWDSTGGYNCKKLCTAVWIKRAILKPICLCVSIVSSFAILTRSPVSADIKPGKKKILILCLLRLKKQLLVNSGNQTVERKDGTVERVLLLSYFQTNETRFLNGTLRSRMSANQWNLCVWERGRVVCPRVTITRSAHITHVASLWAMGCLVGLGFWRKHLGPAYKQSDTGMYTRTQ